MSNILNKKVLVIIILILIVFFAYLFIGKAKEPQDIRWGVNFSQKHTDGLGLDWKETYTAILDDLEAKDIKIGTHWDLIETEEGDYNFDDLDWQIKEAQKRGVSIILVIGMKTPRWPECHIPEWAKVLEGQKLEDKVLKLTETIILRYEKEDIIWAWQVENEPFFEFGECPKITTRFVEKEIELVKSLDTKKRPVIISDSGEWSFWIRPAILGDIVGVTMYRTVWFKELNKHITFPIPSVYYSRRALIINRIFNKDVMCVELQAEPWCKSLLYNCSQEEQKKTMDIGKFKKNIEYAKSSGLDSFYLWGVEWWYLMKEEYNEPDIWNEAKNLFK